LDLNAIVIAVSGTTASASTTAVLYIRSIVC
jgi:hypothetical protein